MKQTGCANETSCFARSAAIDQIRIRRSGLVPDLSMSALQSLARPCQVTVYALTSIN